MNNGDGTYTDRLRDYFGHTSRFSMGSDVADINNDGRPDLISLDMLPEEEIPLKTSEGDDNIQTQRMRTEDYGYYYQFTRNMLLHGFILLSADREQVQADWYYVPQILKRSADTYHARSYRTLSGDNRLQRVAGPLP